MVRTDIRCLYHAHVVTAIADAADPLLGMLPDQSRHVRFLSRRTSACYYGRQLGGDFDELDFEQVETQLRKSSVNRSLH